MIPREIAGNGRQQALCTLLRAQVVAEQHLCALDRAKSSPTGYSDVPETRDPRSAVQRRRRI